jgi:hypothetical protein
MSVLLSSRAREWSLAAETNRRLKMNNDRALDDAELNTVTGGGAISDAAATAGCIGAAMGAIAGIKSVLGAAFDGIPPAPCHPK